MPLLMIMCFLSVFFALTVVSGTNNTEWFEGCNHLVNCINLPPIVGFPFWGGHDNFRPKECGYANMEIKCPNGINATMTINSMSFEMVNVDPFSKRLIIAREDYSNRTCLNKFVNTRLNFKRFTYSHGTLNITAFYGCSNPKTEVDDKFNCTIKEVKKNPGYYTEGVAKPSNYGCHAGVVVPIKDFLEPQLFFLLVFEY
ncbi:hypothetical protein vseg_011086 [Gypsophila vaccaria]